jgi:hypothetical protein
MVPALRLFSSRAGKEELNMAQFFSTPLSGYGPPTTATSWKTGRFTGQDFPLQPDGTLRCPAGSTLTLQERRQEADGSLRLVYAASIRSCRPWTAAASSANGRAAPPKSRAR